LGRKKKERAMFCRLSLLLLKLKPIGYYKKDISVLKVSQFFVECICKYQFRNFGGAEE
jgi:hypothetical protein